MPDDYTIASAAAKEVLDEEVKDFVPPLFQGRIPAGTTQKIADLIAHKAVDAINAAHAAAAAKPQ